MLKILRKVFKLMKNTLFALFLAMLLISMSSAVFADNEGESKDSVKHGGPFRTVPSDAPQVPSYGIYEAKKTIKLFDVDKRQERKEKFKRNVKLVKDIYEGAVLVEYTKDRINDSSLVPRMSETRRVFLSI